MEKIELAYVDIRTGEVYCESRIVNALIDMLAEYKGKEGFEWPSSRDGAEIDGPDK